jgi:hypothetical protein
MPIDGIIKKKIKTLEKNPKETHVNLTCLQLGITMEKEKGKKNKKLRV